MFTRFQKFLSVLASAILLATIALGVIPTGTARAGGNIAICDATTEATLSTAISTGGLVTFGIDCTVTFTSQKNISVDTTIDANGHTVILNGNPAIGLFLVNLGRSLTLKGLTLQNGRGSPGGAVIMRNGGSLVVEDSRFLNNSSTGAGGAIYADVPPPPNPVTPAYITIRRTLFENNTTAAEGGAIYVDGGDGLQTSLAFVEISDSTFRGNQATNNGGAIVAAYHITLNIEGTLFEGNQSGEQGGALYTLYNGSAGLPLNVVNLANNTFSGNSAGHAHPLQSGSNITVSGGAASLDNSNLVHNTFVGNFFAGGDPTRNRGIAVYWPAGTVIARDNIFSTSMTTGVSECVKSGTSYTGNLTTDGTCNSPSGGNTVSGLDTTIRNNGGPTNTWTLLAGSNAINPIPATACTYVSSIGTGPGTWGTNNLFTNGAAIIRDQRGTARPYNGVCDKGAVEYHAPAQNCSVQLNTPFTLAYATFNFTSLGDLSCLTIEEMGSSHLLGTSGIQLTDHWWHINGTNSGGNPASGFSVNLTLRATNAPDNGDLLCRYTGTGTSTTAWDCAAISHDATTITRNGVTGFSDWAVQDDQSPTALTLSSFQAASTTPGWVLPLAVGLISIVALVFIKRKNPHP